MATFAQVLNSTSNHLKYRTVKCPEAMEKAIAPFIARGWSMWSELTKCKFSGFKITLGLNNTYSVVKVTISDNGHIEYEGKFPKNSYVHSENSELIKRIMRTGVDVKQAKAILKELTKY